MHDPAGLQHDQGLDAMAGEEAAAALPVAGGGETALERAEHAVEQEIERQKAELLALRRQFDALSSRLAQDLRLASMVQRGLQPGPVLHPRLDLAREFLPFREVGGDYYDVVMLPEDRVVVAVGDVMGKGIPAALLAATLTATVRSQIQSGQCLPCEVVSHVNRVFWQVTPPGLFASLFYGVLDLHAGTLDYVNAGHHYPFVLRAEGGAVELEEGGTVLGLTEEACFTRGRLQMSGSDLLVLYSDGIVDRSNPAGEMYGLERLEEAALASRNDSARICLYSILGDVQGWSGGTPAEDDATLIVVRLR
jgi:sigma-B regulation protein RsbU (phosphoserine phosphatase)